MKVNLVKMMVLLLATTSANAVFQLTVNDQVAGTTQGYTGGFSRGIVSETYIDQPFSKKEVKATVIDDLGLNIDLQENGLLTKWIQDSLKNPETTRDISISECNSNLKQTGVLETRGNILSEVKISEFNASDRTAGNISILVRPTTSLYKKGTGNENCRPISPGKGKIWLKNNFKFDLVGLDSRSVTSISPIKINFGTFKDGNGSKFGAGKIQNLLITVAGSSLTSWMNWYNSFLVQGKNKEGDELQGSITVLDPTLRLEIFKINLQNVGIVSITKDNKLDNRIDSVTFELYVENVDFKF